MAELVGVKRGPGMRELVDELKQGPDRLDLEIRKELRLISRPIRDDARAAMNAARPVRRTPKHKGAYRWSQVVNAITSSANSEAPTLRFGSTRAPGAQGFEFGSKRSPRFGPFTPDGRAFFPTIREAIPDVVKAVEEVADKYFEMHLGKI